MVRRLLPIGFQDFRDLRESNCYYVDKTGYALQLTRGSKYFLSRPRRFGKSLFLDTLKELFEGSRALFEGLDICEHWDWSVRRPVVRLDFSGVNALEPGDLDEDVCAQLDDIEVGAGVEPCHATARSRFRHLIRTLRRQTGRRVVVLVDEYDKPIVDALDEPEIARANRNYLRSLCSVLKACAGDVRFGFITGVSKFSKVSLFSGLNNLDDITLDPAYAALCGYTEEDLDEVFAPEVTGLDRKQIREWYNGYSWGGEGKVYNPFDLLLLFRKRQFKPWWYQTGTPSFLPRMLAERQVRATALDGLLASEDLLDSVDVESIETEALLFQTGYLTLAGVEEVEGVEYYRLAYPNKEVRQSFNLSLLDYLEGSKSRRQEHGIQLSKLLAAADFAGFEKWLHARIAGIPYQWQTGNTMADYEGFYASLCYAFCVGLGLDVTVEESSSRGRSDMVVRGRRRVLVFEFKVVDQPGSGAAMAQMRDRGYAEKYCHLDQPAHLVAVEFSREKKNVVSVEAELA